MKNSVAGICIGVVIGAIACGVGVYAYRNRLPETVISTSVDVSDEFDQAIVNMCFEDFGESRRAILAMREAFEKDGNLVKPYAIYENRYLGGSMVFDYDMLDKNNVIVHVHTTRGTDGYAVSIQRDTTEEMKAEIDPAIKAMLGPDVTYTVSDTYADYVIIKAQGDVFRWKDGTLERVY